MINWENYDKRQKEIEAKYPWFTACSFEVPFGWIDLVEQCCEELEPILRKNNMYDAYMIFQVKEKFGSLRWYANYEDVEINNILNRYEVISTKICVECGAQATRTSKEWIGHYCDKCYKERKDERES